MDQQSNQKTDRKGCTCRNKPTTDHGEHTGDTVNCAFTPPGTVGQRTTHRHHKSDISRRQRQLQRSTQRNQQTGKHDIHRSTHQVETGLIFKYYLVIIETAVNPVLHSQRHHAQYRIGGIVARTHQNTCNGRCSEIFISIRLPGQVYRRFDHRLRLFRSSQGNHHDQAGTNKEVPRGFGRFKQRLHQESVGCSRASLRHQIHIRRIACQRNTDKVYQVITGKRQSQGKRSQQDHHFKNVHLQPVKNLHQ